MIIVELTTNNGSTHYFWWLTYWYLVQVLEYVRQLDEYSEYCTGVLVPFYDGTFVLQYDYSFQGFYTIGVAFRIRKYYVVRE